MATRVERIHAERLVNEYCTYPGNTSETLEETQLGIESVWVRVIWIMWQDTGVVFWDAEFEVHI